MSTTVIRSGVVCPECGVPLREIQDATYATYVGRRYYHVRPSWKVRPKTYCRAWMSRAAADEQRQQLEDGIVVAS